MASSATTIAAVAPSQAEVEALAKVGLDAANILPASSRRCRRAPKSIYEEKAFQEQFAKQMFNNVDRDELDIPYAQYEGVLEKRRRGKKRRGSSVGSGGSGPQWSQVQLQSVKAAGEGEWLWTVRGRAVADADPTTTKLQVRPCKARGAGAPAAGKLVSELVVMEVLDMHESGTVFEATLRTAAVVGMAASAVTAQRVQLSQTDEDCEADLFDSDEEDEDDDFMVREATVEAVQAEGPTWEWTVAVADTEAFVVGDLLFLPTAAPPLDKLQVSITGIKSCGEAASDNGDVAQRITTTIMSALAEPLQNADAGCLGVLKRRPRREHGVRLKKRVKMAAVMEEGEIAEEEEEELVDSDGDVIQQDNDDSDFSVCSGDEDAQADDDDDAALDLLCVAEPVVGQDDDDSSSVSSASSASSVSSASSASSPAGAAGMVAAAESAAAAKVPTEVHRAATISPTTDVRAVDMVESSLVELDLQLASKETLSAADQAVAANEHGLLRNELRSMRAEVEQWIAYHQQCIRTSSDCSIWQARLKRVRTWLV